MAPHGIRVNAIAPGATMTPPLMNALTDEQRDYSQKMQPMLRFGMPEEISAAVAWLCSDQASFVTGAVIAVDGGATAG